MITARSQIFGTLVAVAVLLHGGHAREDRELIIGSEGVGNERGTVSIQSSGSRHFCGGVLIANDMVLTAAHCTVGTRAQNLYVEVGSNRIGSGTKIQGALKKEHGGYNSQTFVNDIAIIKLKTAARVGFKKIDRGTQSTTTGSGTLYGWGFDESETGQSVQQRVTLPLQPDKNCIEFLSIRNYNTAGQMCAGTTGKNACRGDSGGPLYKGGVVVGLTSFGKGSCRRHTVFTAVAAYRGWVDRTIRELRAGIGSRSLDSRCECVGSGETDVGHFCSNWLSAPVDWCYTENAICANPVESKRYPGRYWTQCVKSEYDLASADDVASPEVDASLGSEDFSKARPFTEPLTTSLDPDTESNSYALVGGVTGAVGLAAVGTAVVILRRRNRSQEGQVAGPFSSTSAAPGLMNQTTQQYRESVL